MRMNVSINTEELAKNAAPDGEFQPIPAGRYNAMITECRVETRQAGDPKTDNLQLVFKLRIQDGDYAKRILFWQVFYTYNNMKPGAQGVFSRQLTNLIKAVGIQGTIDDTDIFLNRECVITVEEEVGTDGKKRNTVDGNKFEPIEQNTRGSVVNSSPVAPSRTTSTYSASNPPAAPTRRRG